MTRKQGSEKKHGACFEANCRNQSMKPYNAYKCVLAGIGFTLLITSLAGCDRGADSDMNTGNAGASPGYNAGYDLGVKLALLRQQQPDIELDEAFKGLLDALSDTRQITSRTELCARLQPVEPAEAEFEPAESFEPRLTQERSHNIIDFTPDNYAALNARRDGVVTLPSGVQYEVVKAGSGEPPQAGDAVEIRYQASLDNGTIIDSTDADGGLLQMPLDDIMAPGLKETLLLMNAGARWQVVIPPNKNLRITENRMLRGRESRMLRGRTLIYDFELVSIDRSLADKSSQ
jgi:FKBP-type peptidyl-prolyl cis-trans isomerase